MSVRTVVKRFLFAVPLRRIAILTLGVMLLWSCTKVGTSGQAADGSARKNAFTIPHVLRYATGEDISTLNPVLNEQGTLHLMSSLTMAWLVRFDHHNRAIPELATVVPTKENGGISSDGKTITYHLRKDAKWSDGADFTAEDVAFSVRTVLNPATNITSRTGFDLITKVDTPDQYTVVFHLRKPYSSFIPRFFTSGGANPCILPAHLLAKLPDINRAPYNSLPIGIGPFKYTAWKRSDAVEMEPNPLYFGGQPKLKKIIFKIVPDRNTVLAQLQSGELDLWYPVTGAYFSRIEAIKGFTYVRQPSYFYDHIDFNLERPALKDKAVRRALRYAIDRKTLLEKVRHGVAVLAESPVPPTYPDAPPALPLIPFDLAKANQTLDEAGWRRGTDGVRVKNGMRLALNYVSSTGNPDTDIQLELIRGWWKAIGVEMSVRRYLSAVLFAGYSQGGIVYNGKFDVINFAWGTPPVDDLANIYSCENIPPKGQNDTRYCDPKVEPLFEHFKATYDPKGQAEDLRREAQIIVDDVPTVITNFREDVFATNADLTGFHPNNTTYFDDFLNVDI